MPLPVLVSVPVPLRMPEKMAAELSPPSESAPEPAVTFPAPLSEPMASAKPFMFSVAPPATVTDEVSAMRSAALMVMVPPLMIVAPVYVFAPPSVSVPAPVFVKEPEPLMTPENVPDELSAPAVSAPEPSVTFPAPVSDATDAVKPFRSSTAPLASESTAEFGEVALLTPTRSVPPVTFVEPV